MAPHLKRRFPVHCLPRRQCTGKTRKEDTESMNFPKRISILLLTVVLVVSAVLPSFAAVDPQAKGMVGKQIIIPFTYQQVMGVQGTFTFSDKQLFSEISLSSSDGMLLENINGTGKVVCVEVEQSTIVLYLKLTLASAVQPGETCIITFVYEELYSDTERSQTLSESVTLTVVPTVDYTALARLIAQAKALNQNIYTPDSWENLRLALQQAEQAMDALTQNEVDTACQNLQQAIDALVTKVDYSQLKALIQTAKELDETRYTAASWTVLKQALSQAEKALNSIVQREVDVAAQQLKEALDNLEELPISGVDYSELLKQIKIADSLKQQDYTPNSWSVLRIARTLANLALDSDDQDVVDAAAADLKQAIAQLVPVAFIDYSELNRQIAIAESLSSSIYTAQSWKNMQTALQAAKRALQSQKQSEVDRAASVLKQAIADLVRIRSDIDYSLLDEQIRIADSLDKKLYTNVSWDNMQICLQQARLATSSTLQSEVDAAAQNLKRAIDDLVLMNYQRLLDAIAAVQKHIGNDDLAQLWEEMYRLLSDAEVLLQSGDQAAVDACAAQLEDLLVRIIAKLAELSQDVTAPQPYDPNGENCGILSHQVWSILFWISLAINLLLAGVIATYCFIKRKRTSDDTPLVDYDIDDDAE